MTLITDIGDLNLLLIVNICREQKLNDSDLFAKQMGAFVTTNNKRKLFNFVNSFNIRGKN